MKRFLTLFTILLFVVLVPITAFAFAYTDSENQINIEITDGTNKYFYTTQNQNLPPQEMDALNTDENDVRLYIVQYTDDTQEALGYSIEMTAEPRTDSGGSDSGASASPSASTEASEMSGESPGPSASPGAATGAALVSINDVPGEETSAMLESMEAAFAGVYQFGSSAVTELGGQPALSVSGIGEEDPDYDCIVYLTANEDNLLVTIVQYLVSEDNQYYDAAQLQLTEVTFGPSEPEPTQTQTPTPTPSATATATVAATVSPTSAPTPMPTGLSGFWAGVKDFFAKIGAAISLAYHTDPNFIFYVVGIIVVLIIIILLILLLRNKRKERDAENDDDGHYDRYGHYDPEAGYDRYGSYDRYGRYDASEYDRNGEPAPNDDRYERRGNYEAYEERGGYDRYDDRPADLSEKRRSRPAEREDGTVRTAARSEQPSIPRQPDFSPAPARDYAEDISRYTRHPGSSVNDVSRYTRGGYPDARQDETPSGQTRGNEPPQGVSPRADAEIGEGAQKLYDTPNVTSGEPRGDAEPPRVRKTEWVTGSRMDRYKKK